MNRFKITGKYQREWKSRQNEERRSAGASRREIVPRGTIELKQVKSLGVEVVKWAKNGLPVRSEEEVERIALICKACPFWNPKGWFGTGKCTLCGCGKLKPRMGTTSCPDKPPRW